MKVGTKSVLFGAHCFFIHPIFVFAAWCKIYGFPWDPRLWVAFFIHDLGYWGKPNMDGDEGETHVEFGAKIMHLFDGWERECETHFSPTENRHNEIIKEGWKLKRRFSGAWGPWFYFRWKRKTKWADFSKYHSRFYAKKDGVSYSKLCVADKFAITLEPHWLYLPRVNWSGEIHEYMSAAKNNDGKYKTMGLSTENQKKWFSDVCDYLGKWVVEHKDIKVDTWTPLQKEAKTGTGVWK